MQRIDVDVIAEAILSAPGWARVGITAPTSTMRREAALELALDIWSAIEPRPRPNGEQPGLAL